MPGGDRVPGLCACFKKPIVAVNGICCWPCMIGRQCNAIEGEYNSLSIPMCIGSLLGTYALCVCCIRRKIAAKYSNFDEGCIGNICVAWLCPCCGLVQTQKFLKRNGANPGLTIAIPKLDLLPDDKKAQFQEERQKRREGRRKRNDERRGRRNNDKWSSSESDTSE